MNRRLFGLFSIAVGLTTLAATAATPVLARPDPANHTWKCTGRPRPDVSPNDCHVTFTGTGGTIKNVVYNGEPPVVAIGVTGGNTVNIQWADNLPVGAVFTFEFTTTHPDVGIAGGTWTKNGEVLRNIILNFVEGGGPPPPEMMIEEVIGTGIPVMGPVGIAVLVGLTGVIGGIVILRRGGV